MAAIKNDEKVTFEKPGKYRIDVQGHLDDRWSDRLAGMRITTSGAEDERHITTLVGQLRDQAELCGVLNSLYNLHLSILLVQYLHTANGTDQEAD